MAKQGAIQNKWRGIYIFTAVFSLYLNVFVGVVQAFQKVPAISALAPTQTGPPFLVAQAATLGLFVLLGFVAMRKFYLEKS
jgi:hypothetical protein